MDSFIFPADWEDHEAVWLAWPPEEWIVGDGQNAYDAMCRVICALLPYVRVDLLVNNAEEEKDVFSRVSAAGLGDCCSVQLRCHIILHTDIWMRDFGPIFVRKREGDKEKTFVLSFDWTLWGYLWHHRRQDDPMLLTVCK